MEQRAKKAFWKGWGVRRFALVRALMRLTRPAKTVIDGRMMYLDRNDAVVSRDLAHGYYEPIETQVVTKYVQEGMTVLDIGANIGYYTLLFAHLVGETGAVHAFEPAPRTLGLLRKNVKANEYANIHVHACAAGAADGEAALYLNDYNAGDNRLYASEGMTTVSIPVRTIDSEIPEYTRVSFVKMDIQGYELHAIKGMQRILKRDRPTIVMELSPKSLLRSGGSAKELLELLENNGYRFEEIGERPEDPLLTSTDTLSLMARYPDTEERFTNILCRPSG